MSSRIPGYVTVAEAAEKLKLDISMVRRYCQDGRLVCAKMGGNWLIWEEDLEAFERQPPGNPNWGRDDSAATQKGD
jgi:excisionase family DNA binding protein